MNLYTALAAFRKATPRTFAIVMLIASPVIVPVVSMIEEWGGIKDFYRTLVRILKAGKAA